MEVAQRLMREVALNEPMVEGDKDKYQDTEFENPFNTTPPATRGPFTGKDGVQHQPALNPDDFVSLELLSVTQIGDKQAQFQFALPQASQHTGCFSGQYLQARVPLNNDSDQYCQRYFSPVSSTNTFGRVDLVMKFESHGEMSRRFQALSPGRTKMIDNFNMKLTINRLKSGRQFYIKVLLDVLDQYFMYLSPIFLSNKK